MPLKKVIACAVIVMIVGLGLTHQNEVKAAWEKMTSLIGQILGISEDTGEYIKQIQNKIAKNGVTVSLEEVAVDDENLWIAYSMTDENGNNDVSMSSIEVSVDGVKLELERQYSNYNDTDSKSKDYVARFSLKASSAKQNFEITIGNFNTKGDQLYIKDKYNFSFTLFHYKDANVHSMANRGFERPAYLLIEQHQGFLVFQPIEMKKELLKERITISSKLKSMKYFIQDKEYDCFEKNDCFYIPITDLNFFYTKEERLKHTSVTVKLNVNLLKGQKPKNLALLKILFH